MADSKVFILTHHYPYGHAETSFLKKEVEYLSKRFDKVYLIPLSKKSDIIADLPSNVILETDMIDQPYVKPKVTSHLIKTWLYIFFLDFMRNVSKPVFYKNTRYYNSLFLHLYSKYLVFEQYIKKHPQEKKLMYTFWFDEWTTLCAIYKQKNQNTIIYSRAHGYDLYEERNPNLFIPFRPFQIRAINKLFTISKHGLHYLQKNYPVYRSKYQLRYMGSSDAGINYDLKKEDILQIISCSNFAPVKRVDLIIETLKLVEIPLHWIHFGGGKGLEEIKEKANQLPEYIKFTFKGDVPNNDILNFYLNNPADLFINVSKSEGLPVSLMEAASFGIPMIAPDVGGVSEIVTPETGILLPPDFDTKELAKIINNFHSNPLNSNQSRKNIRTFWESNFNSDINTEKFTAEFVSTKKIAYRQCTNCLLDTNDDSKLIFDEKGVCHYCIEYQKISKFIRDPERENKLQKLISEIKLTGKEKKYDCVLGVSGGVDSTYAALLTKKHGLRALVVHFDNGWNSSLAVENIENIVKKLGFDLQTYVVNWEEFRDLQRAYFKANVIDIEALTDHAIHSLQYKLAKKHGIKYVITGANIVTEATLPSHWVHRKKDWLNIKSIHKKFGEIKLKTYPSYTFFDSLCFRWISQINFVPLLDYVEYDKEKAKQAIKEEIDWKDYGGKHHESLFTKFYQAYILPNKFNVDKRKSHLSTLISSGQITKEEALKQLQQPLYDSIKLEEDREFVLKKLGFSQEWFINYINHPPVPHLAYPSYENKHWKLENNFYKNVLPLVHFVKKLLSPNKK